LGLENGLKTATQVCRKEGAESGDGLARRKYSTYGQKENRKSGLNTARNRFSPYKSGHEMKSWNRALSSKTWRMNKECKVDLVPEKYANNPFKKTETEIPRKKADRKWDERRAERRLLWYANSSDKTVHGKRRVCFFKSRINNPTCGRGLKMWESPWKSRGSGTQGYCNIKEGLK